MDDLTQHETCTCTERTDDDGQAMKPDLAECGTCQWQWCQRCHPAPSARSWCEGSSGHIEAAARLDRIDAARRDLADIARLRATGHTVIATDEDALRDVAAGRT